MKTSKLRKFLTAIFIVTTVFGRADAFAGKKDKPPKGFEAFKTRQLDTAWINPKFNASDYKTVAIKWADFDYRPGLDEFNTRGRKENYNLSENSKKILREQAQKAFTKQLGQLENFKLIELTEANSDTLVVQITLHDVVNNVPDRHQIVGSTDIFLREFGAVTMKVALYDAVDNQLLFKGSDRENIETISFNLERGDMINARRHTRFQLERWAKGLKKDIDSM